MKVQGRDEEIWGFRNITAPGKYLLTFNDEGIKEISGDTDNRVNIILPTTVTSGGEQEGAGFTIFIPINGKKGEDYTEMGWNRLQHLITITGLASYFEDKFKDIPDDTNPLIEESTRARIVKNLIYKLGGKSVKVKIIMNKVKTKDEDGNEIIKEYPNIEKSWSAYKTPEQLSKMESVNQGKELIGDTNKEESVSF